jgi:hypothetical protein
MTTKTDFASIEKHCKQNSMLSEEVLDAYLLYYASEKENLDKFFDQQIAKYKRITSGWEKAVINIFKTQFILSQVLKKNGYLKKFMTHSAIKNLPEYQKDFLSKQLLTPWRHCFSWILRNPHPNFFEMVDSFTGEEYLLYSPSMQNSFYEDNSSLWFNLISFNGQCYQSFGIMVPSKAINTDDIWFLATALDDKLSTDEEIIDYVNDHPIPFYLIYNLSNLPIINARGNEMRHYYSEDILEDLPEKETKSLLKLEEKNGIVKISNTKYAGFPHFAAAYHHRNNKTLTRCAFTETGFEALSVELIQWGIPLDLMADISASIPFAELCKKIVRQPLDLNGYANLFEKEEE